MHKIPVAGFQEKLKKLFPKHVLWIIIAGLFLRLSLFVVLLVSSVNGENKILSLGGDSNNYQKLAFELKDNYSFGTENPALSAIRTPGYPLFIAFCYKIFGSQPWIVALFQILTDTLLIALIYLLTLKIFNQSSACMASLFYSLEPLAIQYSGLLMSDIMFVFAIVVSAFFLWQFCKNFKMSLLFGYVLSLAVAAYIRPVANYLFILNFLFILIFMIYKKQAILKVILAGTLTWCLLLSPWMIRNLNVHGHWFFSTSADSNSLILYAAKIEAKARGIAEAQVKNEYKDYFAGNFGSVNHANVYELHQLYKDKATETVLKYPLAFVTTYFIGMADMFFSVNRQVFEGIIGSGKAITYDALELLSDKGSTALSNIYRDYPGSTLLYVFLMLAWFLLCYFFATAGLYHLFKNKDWFSLLFLLIPLMYFTLLTGQAGLARFKLPLIPFYLMLSAYGMTQIGSSKKFSALKVKLLPGLNSNLR
jgi:4-amino-4-deoxy-L-arabinose transferase-like glycosyltransferase